MIRIVIENIIVFLIPTLIYVAWIAFRRNQWPGLFRVLSDAPLVWLFVSGATLMLSALLLFSSSSGGRPGEAYVPPSLQNGEIVPGHLQKQ